VRSVAAVLRSDWISLIAAATLDDMAAKSSAAHVAEIAEILAASLMRLRRQKSSQKSADCGEISLDINAQRSGPDRNSAGEG
jgi:hypothetical protein